MKGSVYMNTIEELKKIINGINNVLEAYNDEDYAFRAGAYKAALEHIIDDLEIVNHVLEIREMTNKIK